MDPFGPICYLLRVSYLQNDGSRKLPCGLPPLCQELWGELLFRCGQCDVVTADPVGWPMSLRSEVNQPVCASKGLPPLMRLNSIARRM